MKQKNNFINFVNNEKVSFEFLFTATSLGINLLDTLAVEDHPGTRASEGLVGGSGNDILKNSIKNKNKK